MKEPSRSRILLYGTWALLTLSLNLHAQGVNKNSTSPLKIPDVQGPRGIPSASVLNINTISFWLGSPPVGNYSPGGKAGLFFPRQKAALVFRDGLIWAAKAFVDSSFTQPVSYPVVRVGGGTFPNNVGTQPGGVIGRGPTAVAEHPDDPAVRVYRIRRDYRALLSPGGYPTPALLLDAAEFYETDTASLTPEMVTTVYEQYDLDWKSWPVSRGAPFIDRNLNGIFDPPPDFSPTFTPDSLVAGGDDEPGVGGWGRSTPAD